MSHVPGPKLRHSSESHVAAIHSWQGSFRCGHYEVQHLRSAGCSRGPARWRRAFWECPTAGRAVCAAAAAAPSAPPLDTAQITALFLDRHCVQDAPALHEASVGTIRWQKSWGAQHGYTKCGRASIPASCLIPLDAEPQAAAAQGFGASSGQLRCGDSAQQCGEARAADRVVRQVHLRPRT